MIINTVLKTLTENNMVNQSYEKLMFYTSPAAHLAAKVLISSIIAIKPLAR